MGAVTTMEMWALEEAAMREDWSEEALMDLAGMRLGRALAGFFPKPGTLVIYTGKGHNAGDALIAARLLRDDFGWRLVLRAGFPDDECAPLTRKKLEACGEMERCPGPPVCQDMPRPLVLLDGLLGIGAKGSPRGPLAELAAEMNHLRNTAGARVAAVDQPSGVCPDTGEIHEGAVTADVTFMIGAAKHGLLLARAAAATGALALVTVEPLTAQNAGKLSLISPGQPSVGLAPRPFDFHKGMAGRVSIYAGSARYAGAAAMAASGALRGGAGLVTLFTPPDAIAHIRPLCPPEVMVKACTDPAEITGHDAWVAGPGLGGLDDATAEKLCKHILGSDTPVVVDADALNLLAGHGDFENLRGHHVLTPHPGEFRRLAPDLAELPREEAARAFVSRSRATLLLKGCRTLVTRANSPLWCNSTGTPGMASGGQGDVLSGVIGARLAAGDSPVEAAAFSAWLCGRAAERALISPEISEESLLPSDVLAHIGGAFRDWREHRR